MDEERKKLLKDLIEKKAGCVEMAWNGFVNLYTDDKPCKCKDCIEGKEIENG